MAARGRIGGLRNAALNDPRKTSAPGREASRRALDQRLLAEIDPDNQLPEQERARRLERARKAHFAALSLRGKKRAER